MKDGKDLKAEEKKEVREKAQKDKEKCGWILNTAEKKIPLKKKIAFLLALH